MGAEPPVEVGAELAGRASRGERVAASAAHAGEQRAPALGLTRRHLAVVFASPPPIPGPSARIASVSPATVRPAARGSARRRRPFTPPPKWAAWRPCDGRAGPPGGRRRRPPQVRARARPRRRGPLRRRLAGRRGAAAVVAAGADLELAERVREGHLGDEAVLHGHLPAAGLGEDDPGAINARLAGGCGGEGPVAALVVVNHHPRARALERRSPVLEDRGLGHPRLAGTDTGRERLEPDRGPAAGRARRRHASAASAAAVIARIVRRAMPFPSLVVTLLRLAGRLRFPPAGGQPGP